MTNEDFETLALKIATEVYGTPIKGASALRMREFANRLRDEWVMGLKPVAYEYHGRFGFAHIHNDERPLYDLRGLGADKTGENNGIS